MTSYIVPECPRQCGGHVVFILRIIEPPFQGMDKLRVHDLQCDTCHHIFEKNIFGLKFYPTLSQTKRLIRRMHDELGGEVTITDLDDRWPIDNAIEAFQELNDENDIVWQEFRELKEAAEK